MNDQEPAAFPPEINGVPPIIKILRGWPIIVALAVFGVIVGFILNQREEPIYRAHSVVLLPPSGGGAPSAASLLGAATSGTPGDTLGGIINSYAVQQKVAKAMNEDPDNLKLASSFDGKTNQLEIRADAKSKDIAVSILKYALSNLNDIRMDLNYQTYQRQVNQLEQVINRKETDLTKLKVELAGLANKMDVVPDMSNPGSQMQAITPGAKLAQIRLELSKVVVQLEAMKELGRKAIQVAGSLPTDSPIEILRERVRDKELELNSLRIQLADTSPQVNLARTQLSQLRNQLKDEISKYLAANDAQVSTQAAELLTRKLTLEKDQEYYSRLAKITPKLTGDYMQLYSKIMSQEAQLAAIRGQYATLNAQLAVDPIGWGVLVQPYADEKPINKTALKTMTMWAFLGAIFGSVLSLAKNSRKR